MKTKDVQLNKKYRRSPLKRKPLRPAGESAEEKIRNLQLDIAIYVFFGVLVGFLALFEWWRWYRNTPPQPIIFSLIALIVILFCYFKVRRLLTVKTNWELGREGEIEVANCLEELRAKGCEIFHDIQCNIKDKTFNIDHVIVSPYGIFAIETKTPRKYRSGNRVDYYGENSIKICGHVDYKAVPQAIKNAKWLSTEVLPKKEDKQAYYVTPVVVYPDWSVHAPPASMVWVLNPKQLKWKILEQPPSLKQVECEMIIKVLENQNRLGSEA